ncbi:MAG: hypothetical protein AAF845_08605 [Bacteroidota bacterium]
MALATAGCATTTNPQPPRLGTEAPPGQDLKLAAYNVAFGALVGGVGAVVNGEDGPPLQRFAEGAGWGAAGGTVAYAGKWAAGEIATRERLAYGLPARLVHDVGVSVVENAAHGRPPLDRLAAHVGFVRLDVRPGTGAVQARLLPLNTVAFGLMLAENDLAVGRSLVYGTPLFTDEGRGRSPIFDITANGFAVLGSIYVNRDDDDFHDTAAHELVHALQSHEFVRAEAALLWSPLDEAFQESDTYRALSRWIYLDVPALFAAAYFVVEGGDIDAPCKYDNWLEREAEAFGSRRAVGVCP